MTYSIYVGNLCATTLTTELKDLFREIEEISDVWINQKYKKITYGFVKFTNMFFAEEACRRFNGHKLNFSQITVRLSTETKRKLELKVKRPNDSILLELPKRTGCTKSHLVRKALVKTLRENKEIIDDFTKACAEAEDIAFPRKCEIVKTAPELPNLKALETTVIRYFKPICKKDTLQVDIDLSKGKRLTNEQNDKFFNIQLPQTQSQPQNKTNKTKRKPFALDYRSVCD